MTKTPLEEHKCLTLWAADCAEHVLLVFSYHRPDDERVARAIVAARAWVQGELSVTDARRCAFAAHAAARDSTSAEAKAAARAAGHAAATAHVPEHAKYAAAYACKAVADPEAERKWQLEQWPEPCKSLIK